MKIVYAISTLFNIWIGIYVMRYYYLNFSSIIKGKRNDSMTTFFVKKFPGQKKEVMYQMVASHIFL